MNWVKEDGSPEWTFEIVGFVNAGEKDDKVFANELYFNYDYLDEARATGKGTVHQYVVAIDDASRASEISQAIDHLFANSSAETTTLNEREYVVAQLRQVGDIRMFVNSIIGAVLFTLLFVAGNTMSQSVRDRIPELGVLKTLGFTDTAVSALVVVEASLLCTVAAAIGLTIAAAAFPTLFVIAGIHRADSVAAPRLGHRLRHRAVVGSAQRPDPGDSRASIDHRRSLVGSLALSGL